MDLTWKWIGGRLCRSGVSLSVSEAYEAIPKNPEIAAACKGILIPCDTWVAKKSGQTIRLA